MRSFTQAAAVALVLALSPELADAKLASLASGANVSFTALGPAGMRIVGTTPDLVLADNGQTVTVTVPLARLTTGIDLRDRHMREKYLEVPKFPSAVLTLFRAQIKAPAVGAPVDVNVAGTMTIHGQSRPVTVHYTASQNGTAFHVSGTTHVVMTDYGIVVPSYLGITVKPDVDIAVTFDAADTP